MDLSLHTVPSTTSSSSSSSSYSGSNHNKPSAVCVSVSQASNQVLVADDHAGIHLFSPDADHIHDITTNTNNQPAVHVTALAWHPLAHPKKKEHDLFLLGLADGTFRICNRAGRADAPKLEAPPHNGAVTSVLWARDGSSFATAGEDGKVKSWSRTGMFRANLAASDFPVIALRWSPESDHVLFAADRHLVVRPLQPSSKQTMWKAHDGAVLCADWNARNGLVASGGEDCRYRLWDAFGRQLYCSAPCDYAVSAIGWAPSGRYFAAGSFNMLRLCDKAGWSYSRAAPAVGSVYDVAWSADSTQLAAACASGDVLFGALTNREACAGEWEARQVAADAIAVANAATGLADELQFKERVTEMSLSTTHLIAVTASQCCIYALANLNTPHIVELRGTVSLLLQSAAHFLMVDSQRGLQIIGYDGRPLSTPKYAGMRPEMLSPLNVAYTPELLAIVDSADAKTVRLIEPLAGRQLGTLAHSLEVEQVALSPHARGEAARRLVLVDKNRDLYITPTQGLQELTKLSTMVDAVRWADDTAALAALSDGHLVYWYAPEAVFVDRDMLPRTVLRTPTPDVGKSAEVSEVRGSRATIRRADGATVVYDAAPFPAMLERHAAKKEWDAALRLCRYVKSPQLWACLAVLSVGARDLATAEVAYAAIDAVDKLAFMSHIRELPTPEAREAEILLFQRRRAEAITVLVQAGWIYRAIKMAIRTHAWEQAYDLARAHKQHLDTVLYHRQLYLESVQRAENIPKLQQLAQELGAVDAEAIRAKKEQEKERERARDKPVRAAARGAPRGAAAGGGQRAKRG